MRLTTMGLTVINLGQGVGRHGPDLVAFGWQGNRFRLIVAEVKGTRKKRVLTLLDKLVDDTMQMSVEWLSGAMDTMAAGLSTALGSQIPPGPLQEGFERALRSGQLDLYLLRARDMRDDRWETRGYRLVSLTDPKSVGRLHTNPIDDIEKVQIHNHPSY